MEKWIIGLKGLILGLGTVFLVLILLIGFIYIMSKIVQKIGEKPSSVQGTEKKVITQNVVKPQDDEGEIIAVIAAALSCMAQREGKKFNIRSFRRV